MSEGLASRWSRRVRLLLDRDSRRAAIWALREVRRLRRELPDGGLAVSVNPPPPLPKQAVWGVLGVTSRLEATCLERSLVLQSWYHHHGRSYTVVVGVGPPTDGFEAHAWIEDYDHHSEGAKYHELTRVPPR